MKKLKYVNHEAEHSSNAFGIKDMDRIAAKVLSTAVIENKLSLTRKERISLCLLLVKANTRMIATIVAAYTGIEFDKVSEVAEALYYSHIKDEDMIKLAMQVVIS